jgi:hypothetical protein
MKKPLVALLTLAWCLTASATLIPGDTLHCTVTGVYDVDNNGKLANAVTRFNDAIGSQFTLDRSTGVMRGRLIDNDGLYVSVFYYGDTTGDAYQAFGHNPNNTYYSQFISVETFVDGEKKPFRYMDSLFSAVGYCN